MLFDTHVWRWHAAGEAELTSAIAIEAGGIPAVALPDAMDRLLVATPATSPFLS